MSSSLEFTVKACCLSTVLMSCHVKGLWGGATGTCSGGRHSEECFSTRFMWRTGGAGEVYGYITRSHQRSDLCDQPDVHCDPVYGSSLGRGKWHFRKGHWQNIAQLVHLNTPGRADGYIKVQSHNYSRFCRRPHLHCVDHCAAQ